MGDMIQRLTTVAEDYFDCRTGEPRAFFEIPQRGGDSIRVIYCSYIIAGKDLMALEQWMLDILTRLYEKAGYDAMLYWRLADKFGVELGANDLYYLRTRLAVLDRDLNTVRLDEMIKLEGEPSKVLT